MQRTVDIKLSFDEEFWVVVKWAKRYPNVLQTLLGMEDIKINCPFPECCNLFPCKTLYCMADVCSNGYTYRMS